MSPAEVGEADASNPGMPGPAVAPTRVRVLVALGVAIAAVSCSSTLIVLAAPLSPLAIAAGRVALMGFLWTVAAGGETKVALDAVRRDRGLLIASAVAATALAIHFASWTASLSFTPVVQGAVVVSTTPIFAGLFARALGDTCPPRFYAGMGVVLVGLAVLVGGGTTEAGLPDARPALGNSLALLAAALAAVYLACGRSVRARVPLRGYLALVNGGAGLILILVALALGTQWRSPGAGLPQVMAVIGLALVPGMLGHGLLNWAARHLPVHIVSIVALLEPPGSTLLAWLVVGQGATGTELLGALVMLLGIALSLPRRLDRRPPPGQGPGARRGRS